LGRRPQKSDVEKITEKQVLGFKPAPRLEQIGDIGSEQVDDQKHRIGHCADSASPRETAGPNFGSDRAWLAAEPPENHCKISRAWLIRSLSERENTMAKVILKQ
jgi:hypothetical protein